MGAILITGPTGTVGREVLRSLQAAGPITEIRAAVRAVDKARRQLAEFSVAAPVAFDFEDATTFASALAGVDRLFLLRPPQLADVERDFLPLLRAARAAGVRHVVFLSVQGADDNPIIPHHKIEKALQESGLACTFLRPPTSCRTS